MSNDSAKSTRLRSKKPTISKTKRLEVRMFEPEMEQLRELADRHGLTVSAYAVRKLLGPPSDDDVPLEIRQRPSPRKAELYRAFTRANLILSDIRHQLADADGTLSRPLLRAAVKGLLTVEEQLSRLFRQ